MGFLAALYLGLFVWCLQRKQPTPAVKTRLVALILIGAANFVLAFVFNAMGATAEEKDGAWVIIPLYFIFFGWRMVMDAIALIRRK